MGSVNARSAAGATAIAIAAWKVWRHEPDQGSRAVFASFENEGIVAARHTYSKNTVTVGSPGKPRYLIVIAVPA